MTIKSLAPYLAAIPLILSACSSSDDDTTPEVPVTPQPHYVLGGKVFSFDYTHSRSFLIQHGTLTLRFETDSSATFIDKALSMNVHRNGLYPNVTYDTTFVEMYDSLPTRIATSFPVIEFDSIPKWEYFGGRYYNCFGRFTTDTASMKVDLLNFKRIK